MCKVLVTVIQFMPWLNIRNVFWTVEYQSEECLLVFTRRCEIPVHFPAITPQPSVMLMKASMKKTLFRWYRAVHVQVREELRDVFVFPTRECGEYCMRRACIHTMCSKCNISDLAILLRGWNFASGSVAVASCIVTSCLLMKRSYTIYGVNNTHNFHVWADENPHATVESNFQQRFSVNEWYAVLDDQLMGPFIFEGRLTGEAFLRFLKEELPSLFIMCL